MESKIEFRDPSELKVHPEAARFPELGKEDAQFLSMVEDIRARGIDEPLICVRPDLIIDGRHRWRAAKRLQLESVPVIFRAEADVVSVVLGNLLQRRHYTKGALAYLALPFLDKALEEAKARRLQNLRKGQCFPENPVSILSGKSTVEELAHQMGIGRQTLLDAKNVREALHKDKERYEFEVDGEQRQLTLKEYFEGKLFAPPDQKPLGLGAIMAGIAGMKSTKGKAKVTHHQLELFERACDTWAARLVKVMDDPKAEEIFDATVEKIPVAACERLAAAIRKRLKGAK